ncbi:MAG: ParA family protein [Oscillospiraceae bacterium]
MKTISFMIAKGGVGKTITSVNVAYILSTKYNKRVLLIDLDPQGNASKAYGRYSQKKLSVSDLLVDKSIDIKTVIQSTDYDNIDIITSNNNLIAANQSVLMDITTVQQTRLKKHLVAVQDEYDYCIFDCPAEFSMSTLNAFVVTDDVLIPTRVDSYSFDAIVKVYNVIQEMQDFNSHLRLLGCFVTMFQKNNLNKEGIQELHKQKLCSTFNTSIRYTVKVPESTFAVPLCAYAPNSTAAQDYYNLVEEYLTRCST